jgi:large subunit ribosomal protein L1
MTQEIIDAVKEAKEQAKPRNFTQSIDVIINIKDLDVRKPENRFSEEVALPNGRGKEIKIGVIVILMAPILFSKIIAFFKSL